MGQSKDTSHERRGAKSHTIQFRFRMRCVATSAIHAVDAYSCLGSRDPFCAFALAIFHFFIKSMPYLATVGARSGVLAKWMQWMRLAGWLACWPDCGAQLELVTLMYSRVLRRAFICGPCDATAGHHLKRDQICQTHWGPLKCLAVCVCVCAEINTSSPSLTPGVLVALQSN